MPLWAYAEKLLNNEIKPKTSEMESTGKKTTECTKSD